MLQVAQVLGSHLVLDLIMICSQRLTRTAVELNEVVEM